MPSNRTNPITPSTPLLQEHRPQNVDQIQQVLFDSFLLETLNPRAAVPTQLRWKRRPLRAIAYLFGNISGLACRSPVRS